MEKQMTNEDRRVILSCFANGFEFKREMAEVNTSNGKETYTVEYMNELAETLRDALEKQMQKAVIITENECICPNCGFDMMGVWDDPEAEDPYNCPRCGQALKWGGE